tara:strand:- start:155 stop:382 length:228 start_codon:yes stop_codon:yes gene_type:complete
MFRHLFNNLRNLRQNKNFYKVKPKIYKTKPLNQMFKFCACKNKFLTIDDYHCDCGKMLLNDLLSYQEKQVKLNTY